MRCQTCLFSIVLGNAALISFPKADADQAWRQTAGTGLPPAATPDGTRSLGGCRRQVVAVAGSPLSGPPYVNNLLVSFRLASHLVTTAKLCGAGFPAASRGVSTPFTPCFVFHHLMVILHGEIGLTLDSCLFFFFFGMGSTTGQQSWRA